LCWSYGSAGAEQKADPDLTLKSTDSLCDLCRRQIKQTGGLGKRTLLDHGNEAFEKARIHSKPKLSSEVPALPAFQLQRAVSTMIRDLGYDYWTGTVYTTNRRVWEHDDRFRDLLRRTRSMAIDMETATIFAAGFANHISTGALLLVSDQPMIPEGVKTEASDQTVTANYVERRIKIGIEALKLVRRRGRSVKHLRHRGSNRCRTAAQYAAGR
jgi:Phosphorylase superfamily